MKQHLMTGAAAAAAVVQMPRPINWPRRGRLSFLSALLVFLATFGLSAQIPGACNNPISGKGVVVDDLSAGLINLLATNPNLNNILDGDLNNFAEFAGLGSIAVGNLQLVNVKDVNNTYPAGRRTGFVIEATGGLLSLDLLNGLAIQTSLNNVVQETVAISNGSGGGINLSLLSAENAGRRRVDFLTSLPFDEVALVKTGLLNTELDGLRVYYAYEEVDGCDYDCSTAITTANFPLASVSSGGGGLLGLASFGPTANVIDPDTTNFATSAIGVLAAPFIEVNTGTLISGGNDVGFVIETAGLLGTGLLNLSLLDGVTITTYSTLGTPLEVFDAGSGLASVGLLSGTNVASISFKTTLPFASVRIAYPSVLNLSSRRVYYAFVRFDDDGDGFPNCVDKCPGGSDALDADGDGVPDACDMDCALAPIAPVKVCPDGLTSTAQLPAAGPGQVWSADPGNPAAATIDNNGLVSGLTVQGIYSFTLTDPSIPGCSQTVTVDFRQASVDTDCNDPVSGPGTVVGNLPGCTLCASPDAGNLTDGDLSNAVSTASLLNLGLLGSATPLISVVDTTQIYPGGTRAGFVVQTGGLLNAGLLSGFQIRTYLDGVPVEVSGTGGSLLGADALAPSG